MNEAGNEGLTPLHNACLSNDTMSARFLIYAGADVNACNKYKDTPLHMLCKRGSYELAWLLLRNGTDVEAVNSAGMRPLDYHPGSAVHELIALSRSLIVLLTRTEIPDDLIRDLSFFVATPNNAHTAKGTTVSIFA